MMKSDTAWIAETLGASRVVELESKAIGGPLDLLALREEFNQRRGPCLTRAPPER